MLRLGGRAPSMDEMGTGSSGTRGATRLPPGHASAPVKDGGIRFGLDEAAFLRWWHAAVLAEDADEFVHLYGGTMDQARFVCSLDYLTSIDQQAVGSDVIVRAFVTARNLPEDSMRDIGVRMEAQAHYTSPPVMTLMDRVRYRSERAFEERIRRQTAARLEAMYTRVRKMDEDDPALLSVERGVLDASVKFLAMTQKDRHHVDDLRARRSIADAAARSREVNADQLKAPSKEEAKNFMVMLRETLGDEEFAEALKQVALPPSNEVVSE